MSNCVPSKGYRLLTGESPVMVEAGSHVAGSGWILAFDSGGVRHGKLAFDSGMTQKALSY